MTRQVDPKVLEIVGRASFALPAAAQATAGACTIVTDVVISTLTAGALTIAAQPDYPRTLRVIVTDANSSITGATVTIVGFDQNGVGISETFTLSAGAASTTINGTKAFAKVTSATWALVAGAVTGGADAVAVGYGAKLGLPGMPNCIYDRLVKAEFNGANDLGTLSTTYGLYTPAGTMDGLKPLEVQYIYKYLMNW